MNYDDKSDFEINMAVMKVELRGQFIEYHEQEVNELASILGVDGRSPAVRFTTPLGRKQSFDGCNNPSDAWPIINRNKISIAFGSELATARLFTCTNVFEVVDKNPLKAAMICFLKMKESENG